MGVLDGGIKSEWTNVYEFIWKSMGNQIGVSPLGGNGIDLRMLYYTYVACVMWPIHLKSSVKFSLLAFFPRSFGQLKSNLDFSTKTSSQVDLFSSSAIISALMDGRWTACKGWGCLNRNEVLSKKCSKGHLEKRIRWLSGVLHEGTASHLEHPYPIPAWSWSDKNRIPVNHIPDCPCRCCPSV